jgi:hypothetical protein
MAEPKDSQTSGLHELRMSILPGLARQDIFNAVLPAQAVFQGPANAEPRFCQGIGTRLE